MATEEVWITKGFEDFRNGSFGNAGHNLYVSKAGLLQRIHQFDFNGNGYFDLVFSNSQSHLEMAPVGVYRDPLGDRSLLELPADGAWSGAVLDLNGDGFDDLVLGNWYNGIGMHMNAFIYFGSPDGWSERRHVRLPAPRCTSVAAGDFNGDGRPDLAFLSEETVRVFFQSAIGFEPKRFTQTDISGEQLGAWDLDGDGCADLVVRYPNGEMTIFWGAPGGLDPILKTPVPAPMDEADGDSASNWDRTAAEFVQDAKPLVQFIELHGQPHLFVGRAQHALLVPVEPNRQFGTALRFECPHPLAVAAGDLTGSGNTDLVFACRPRGQDGEFSCIYWGVDAGMNKSSRTDIASFRACDVAVGDLDGDGRDEIVLCQGHTEDMFTHQSPVYKLLDDGRCGEVERLTGHDARRVFLARPAAGQTPDLVFVNTRSRNKTEEVDVSIYFGGPDGFHPDRRQDLPGWGAIGALCCDLNDDGLPDLVLVNSSHNTPSRDPGSYVFLNTGSGFDRQPTWSLPSNLAHGACCADLNRDGYLDLVFGGHRSADLLIFYGTEDGFDRDHPERVHLELEDTECDGPLWIYLADLNNDGWLDLVVPQSKGDRSFILWGGPQGFSMERSQILAVWKGVCARAADLTGNGYLDLLVGGGPPSLAEPDDCFLHVYWNGPEGLSESRKTLLPANNVLSVGVADLDNDGSLDLFVPCYHNGRTRDIESYIYWNKPDRGFSALDFTRLFAHSASGCVAVDFDEDGWTDLAIANHKIEGDHVGWSGVWWNGPDGFSETRQTKLPTKGPHGMICVDPGNIADRGDEEYYESPPFQVPDGAELDRVEWKAELPAKTWIGAQLRNAGSESELEVAPWSGPDGNDGWYRNGDSAHGHLDGNTWIQYRLALGAVNGLRSPRVSEVSVSYTS
jgi:hypothetical protein